MASDKTELDPQDGPPREAEMGARGDLTSLSHELKNALNLISLQADLLSSLLGSTGSPRVQDALGMIRRGISEQRSAIAGLLDISPANPSDQVLPLEAAKENHSAFSMSGAESSAFGNAEVDPERMVPDKSSRVQAAGGDQWASPWRGLHVLLADDAVEAVGTLAQLLDMEGAVVAVAHDGTEALTAFEQASFDIVFADLGMPNMDGYEFAMRLRALSAGNEVPLVAVTGFTRPSDVQSALKAGFDAHLGKPVSVAALTASLRKLTGRNVPAADNGTGGA